MAFYKPHFMYINMVNMNNDMEIINNFLKSKNENLECIKELSGGTNNRIYSVNDKYFVKFKDYFLIVDENIHFSKSRQIIGIC